MGENPGKNGELEMTLDNAGLDLGADGFTENPEPPDNPDSGESEMEVDKSSDSGMEVDDELKAEVPQDSSRTCKEKNLWPVRKSSRLEAADRIKYKGAAPTSASPQKKKAARPGSSQKGTKGKQKAPVGGNVDEVSFRISFS